jgi:hypothetical protein
MLLAEAFVLLALRPEGTPARGRTNQAAVAVGVTGALVTELIQARHLRLDDGRINLTGTTPSHPLLAQVLENLKPYEGKELKRKLAAVKHSGWSEVVDAMVAEGVLGREKALLRPTRHPVADKAVHAALVAEIRVAASTDGPLDERTATLLALAGPCQMLEVVAPERADRAVGKRRIAEATEQVPAAAAVKYVIAAMQSAAAVAAG